MSKVVCFTGHRPNKLYGYDIDNNFRLLNHLRNVIVSYIETYNVTTFISGMALGIDMWAAKIVLDLKNKYPQIKLLCAIPCDKQYSKWNTSNINEWFRILERADEVHYVSKDSYTNWCMQKRNEWMVDNSNYVIAVWDGLRNGGTFNCVNYALKNKKEVYQINPKEFPNF